MDPSAKHLLVQNASRAAMRCLACAALLLPLAACIAPRRVAVEFEFDVQVARTDQSGKVWRSTSEQIVVTPRAPPALSKVPVVDYNGDLFAWKAIRLGGRNYSGGDVLRGEFGGEIVSKMVGPVCFGFDQATISSNMGGQAMPLRATSQTYAVFGTQKQKRNDVKLRRDNPEPFQASPLCFEPNERSNFLIIFELAGVFPNAAMFNVKLDSEKEVLLEGGVGNWFKLQVPIHYDGGRDHLEVTFKAKSSVARPYYSP